MRPRRRELLAGAKAESHRRPRLPGRLVLGADQTLARGNTRFGKPADREAAAGAIARIAPAAATNSNRRWYWYATAPCCSTVSMPRSSTMRDFSDSFLDDYLDMMGDTTMNRASEAYQLEGIGIHLFERMKGEHDTILGLPLLPLLAFLRPKGFVAGYSA